MKAIELSSTFRLAALAAATLLSGACSGSLVRTQSGQGIPVSIPKMFRETFTYTLHSKLGNKCTHAPGYRYVNLPSDTIYLNVETAPLAKTQFTLKLGEAGYLQELTFNSEPAAEAITAVGGLAKDLLPFAGITSTAADLGPDPACDTGEVFKCYEPVQPTATATSPTGACR